MKSHQPDSNLRVIGHNFTQLPSRLNNNHNICNSHFTYRAFIFTKKAQLFSIDYIYNPSIMITKNNQGCFTLIYIAKKQ